MDTNQYEISSMLLPTSYDYNTYKTKKSRIANTKLGYEMCKHEKCKPDIDAFLKGHHPQRSPMRILLTLLVACTAE